MFPILPVAKFSVQIAASIGVSKILAGIVKNNVIITTTIEKITVNTGTLVLGSMLIDQSAKHIEEVSNNAVAWFKNRNNEDETDLEVVK